MISIRDIIGAFTSSESHGVLAEDDYIVHHQDHNVISADRFRKTPRFISADVRFADLESMSSYTDKFKTESTIVYLDKDTGSVTSRLDYHLGPDKPATDSHSAQYAPKLSDQWLTWTRNDKDRFTQSGFGDFIEDNIGDINNPDPATILQVAKEMSARKSVIFKSGVNTSNGDVQFTFNEKTSGRAGTLDIPQMFKLLIPVYEGGDGYPVPCRLKYRIGDEGQLGIWYELVGKENILKHATQAQVDAAKADPVLKELPIFMV